MLLRLVVTWLWLVILGIQSRSCSYKVPPIDDVILNVPLEHMEEEEDNENSRSAREITDDYRPLRIKLYYDQASISSLSPEKQLFINSSLLPDAVGYWSRALMVRYSTAPIRLNRKCVRNHYYIHPNDRFQSCASGCRNETKCGELIIPDEHLWQCRSCSSASTSSCTTSGPLDGPGVPDADFLLYVSAVATERCGSVDTVAYAAHCQQEVDLDRPIAGHVNLCPSGLSTHRHDEEVLISTVKHEILHALGFSAGLYAFFRDDQGRPRTKRNRYGKPISLNSERGYYDWDETTIKKITRTNWWTQSGPIEHSIQMMVTDRVRAEAVRHFGCAMLEGAELENQGGDGTALTHWEKRMFENEAMTGTHTQNPVYSRLTLALLEDSGWYRANYGVAEDLHWGSGLGCDFSMASCGDWIRNRRAKGHSPAPFCDELKHDGKRSLAVTRCTAQRDSLALCNLVPYQQPLAPEYRNFERLYGVQKETLQYYGGSVELADFCSYNQEFEWRSLNAGDRRDSRCELIGNSPQPGENAIMELYGNGSRCFDLAGSWTERRCGRVRTFVQYRGACYQYYCLGGRVYVDIFNGTDVYPCYHAGQRIQIRRIVNGWLREGTIICPPCEEMCGEGHQNHRGSGNAESEGCRSDERTPNPIGDQPLDEPCGAFLASRRISMSLIMAILLVIYNVR